MKKHILVLVTSTIAVSLFCLQLMVSNSLATKGAELSDLQVKTDLFMQENEELTHKIASASSLMAVSQRAKELGFSRASMEYLKRPPVAFGHE